jgi:hypothetical protein
MGKIDYSRSAAEVAMALLDKGTVIIETDEEFPNIKPLISRLRDRERLRAVVRLDWALRTVNGKTAIILTIVPHAYKLDGGLVMVCNYGHNRWASVGTPDYKTSYNLVLQDGFAPQQATWQMVKKALPHISPVLFERTGLYQFFEKGADGRYVVRSPKHKNTKA